MDCTYCGCAVERHAPVYAYEPAGDGDERVLAGAYCNYGCLRVHIDEAGLAEGATCELPADR